MVSWRMQTPAQTESGRRKEGLKEFKYLSLPLTNASEVRRAWPTIPLFRGSA